VTVPVQLAQRLIKCCTNEHLVLWMIQCIAQANLIIACNNVSHQIRSHCCVSMHAMSPSCCCFSLRQIRAYFEAHKDEYAMRQRFDPREHLKAVDVRADAAAAAAAKLVEDMAAGAADPAKEGFNQGNGSAAADTVDDMAIDAPDEAAEGDEEKVVDVASKVLSFQHAWFVSFVPPAQMHIASLSRVDLISTR